MIRVASIGFACLHALPRRADTAASFRAFYAGRRLRGSISPAAVDSIASAIQTQEGYFPGSVAYQNNNPGNLVYAGQAGASPGAGGFAAFDSYADGLAALKSQITLDATRGTDVNGNPTTTISQLITSWAPPSQNNTAAYIDSVTAQTGYDPNALLSSLGSPLIDSSSSDASVSLPASNDWTAAVLNDLSGSVDIAGSSVPASLVLGVALAGGLLLSRLF